MASERAGFLAREHEERDTPENTVESHHGRIHCGMWGTLSFLVVIVIILCAQNYQIGGAGNPGFKISVVVSITIVLAVSMLLVLFNPKVYGFLFCVGGQRAPMETPYWYWSFLTGFVPYAMIWVVLLLLGDHWLGKTGSNSRTNAHVIWAIVGLNTAIGIAFGFFFGHCGVKDKYPTGKCNYVGIFTPVLVMLIWIFLFTTQGVMFYIFSTHEDVVLRSLGQFIYWICVLLIWSYLLVGVFVVVPTKPVNGRCVPVPQAYNRQNQVLNVLATLILGMVTWEMLLFGIVVARADEHPHLSKTYVYLAAGMQGMAYSFVLLSIITAVAKQAVTAGKDTGTFGIGQWITGPEERPQ